MIGKYETAHTGCVAMIRTLLILTIPIALFASSEGLETESDKRAITKATMDYGHGWYKGNAEQMERALHPDLAKRVLMPDARTGKNKVEHMSALHLVQKTRKGGGSRTPSDQRETRVTIHWMYLAMRRVSSLRCVIGSITCTCPKSVDGG